MLQNIEGENIMHNRRQLIHSLNWGVRAQLKAQIRGEFIPFPIYKQVCT